MVCRALHTEQYFPPVRNLSSPNREQQALGNCASGLSHKAALLLVRNGFLHRQMVRKMSIQTQPENCRYPMSGIGNQNSDPNC